MRRLFGLFALLLLAGCQSLAPRPSEAPAPPPPPQSRQTPPPQEAAPEVVLVPELAVPEAQEDPTPANLWQQIVAGFQLDAIDHPAIEREIQAYTRFPDSLTRQLARGEPFLYHILQQVQRRGLPAELALLPCVESGYRPNAYSPDGAAGLWQFMPATGRHFGLQQDWWYDARRDPVASTQAALDYLEQLHRRFDGDWLLAMAAYNAGGAAVARAIRANRKRGRPTDFWSLRLPRETRHYVPRILALARIIADPDRYRVALPEIPTDPRFVRVEIGHQLDLKVAAELADMSPDELFRLNAGFNRWTTHPEGPHYLLLPIDKADRFQQRLAALPPEKRLRWTRYRIRPGDSLSRIAHKYGVTVQALMKANNLRSHRIRAGQTLIVPLSASPTLAGRPSPMAQGAIKYRVRKGDSLWRIARRFRVKVSDLKRWNGLAGDKLRPGQTLTVRRRL